MATISLDQRAPATQTSSPSGWRRWWPTALIGLLCGLTGGLVATLAQANDDPAPTAHQVRFEVVDATDAYAAVTQAAVREVDPMAAATVKGPATLVLVVKGRAHTLTELAATAQRPRGWCRVWVDDVLLSEQSAAAGELATCVVRIAD